MSRKHVLLAAALLLPLGCGRKSAPDRDLILATTTSTQDSGLLDDLAPRFERERGIRVKVIAVGTGEALAMGRRGDADVLLVHARQAEDEFMANGFGSLRLDVMHNDFVLLGPTDDPAGVRGAGVVEAFEAIARKGATFVSRSDRSGTHRKEQDLWVAAGVTPGGPWYLETGQGMGETLLVAGEKRAYTLADRGTWLARQRILELEVVSEGDSRLANPYGVIVVDPAKFPGVNGVGAEAFARWLVTPAVQRLIGEFGVARLGRPPFIPDALPR